MTPITIVRGRTIPIAHDDVDTDQIIPAQFLKVTEREGLGRHAFQSWRSDPSFPLNDPKRRDATILLSGRNFGCGSSREHAAWALYDLGIRVVIAPSFADIFRNNCVNVGILTVALDESTCRSLLEESALNPSLELTVELESQRISCSKLGLDQTFSIDPFVKRRLLLGLDMIELTLEGAVEIERHESTRPQTLPRTTS